jgi:hypothetical protein
MTALLTVLLVVGLLAVVELLDRIVSTPVIELETAFYTLKTVWLILNT